MNFTIFPVLGLKTDVPPDNYTLFQMIGDSAARTHCVDCLNVDMNATRNAASKTSGYGQWSSSAAAVTSCLGMFELYDGINRTHWVAMGDGSSLGRIYRFNSSRAPVRIVDVSSTEFASGISDLYTFLRFGEYIISCDYGEHTPYCADYNDTALVKLISSGTEYKFRSMEEFQRRLIGIYPTDQTNGDIQLMYTAALPSPGSSCTFPAGNQLYKSNDDPIVGIKKVSQDACLLYGENSIDSIDYYPYYLAPFSLRNLIPDQGAVNHHCIVLAGGSHYLFNRNYGFCEYRVGTTFPYGAPISYDIEPIISTIKTSTYPQIVGAFIPLTKEVCWTVCLYGSSTPTHILYYNTMTKSWRIEDKVAYFVCPWRTQADVSWNDLINLGYTTWASLGNQRWSELVSETHALSFANTDGHVYQTLGNSAGGSDINGYRTEPILHLGLPEQRSTIIEIWFDIVKAGNYSIYCYYRGGNTVAETVASQWTALNEISCDSPANPVTICGVNNRYHQIKWGTDGANEPFVVSAININYNLEGAYS